MSVSISKPEEHIIDLDADPHIPDGWRVAEHQKGGAFKWNAANVALHFNKGQKKEGRVINGNKLRWELANKSVFNANLLDYLLANPHLIPEEWKYHPPFFWGTIYHDRVDSLCVRYLYQLDDGWYWSFRWLGLDWSSHGPAVVDAS